MGFYDQRNYGADSRTARDAKNVRVGQGIAQQRLKTSACHRKRSTYKDTEKNARQSNIKNDELVFAGELAGLTKEDAEKVVAQTVERDGHSAELERDHHDNEQNGREKGAVSEQATERQRAQAQTSKGAESPLEDCDTRSEACG
jgi:hypothetical protein